MQQRLDLAEPMLRERTQLADIGKVRQEVMAEFEVILTQMPYVGGPTSRMSDFFMRLTGFMAIGRVLRRYGVAVPVIGDIERETYKAQLLTVPEAERLASGQQFMSAENRALLREQAVKSLAEEYKEDFVYDFVEPGPGDNFEQICRPSRRSGNPAAHLRTGLRSLRHARRSPRTHANAGWRC